MGKRILAFLLSLVMVIGLIPQYTYAAEETGSTKTTESTKTLTRAEEAAEKVVIYKL